MWTYYNIFSNAEVPYPSLADVFFIFFIPLTALALVKFLKVYQILVTRRVVIESFVVFLLAVTGIFLFQGLGGFSGELGALEQAFNLLYPLTDAVLITAAVIVFRSSGGALHKNLILLVGGYLAGALADLTFSYRSAHELYWNGDIADVLFMVSGFFMALAALHLAREFGELRGNQKSIGI